MPASFVMQALREEHGATGERSRGAVVSGPGGGGERSPGAVVSGGTGAAGMLDQ